MIHLAAPVSGAVHWSDVLLYSAGLVFLAVVWAVIRKGTGRRRPLFVVGPYVFGVFLLLYVVLIVKAAHA